MNKQLFKLAIPNIISNITIPLSASIDTALMGHLNFRFLGAIALGSMIFTFLYGSFNFLRMGTTGIVSQEYGRANQKEITLVLVRALVIAIFISLFVIILKKQIFSISILFLNADSLVELIKEYFNTRIYAVFGAMINFVLIGWYFGVSNSIAPLIMTATINISNVIFSYIFVYILDMNISGVALGTLISQYLGVFVGLYFLKKYVLTKITFNEIFNKDKLVNFFHINKDIFIRTMVLTATLGVFYSLASKDSVVTLAVATLIMQFMTWMAYAIDGFANASESLVGKYFGINDKKRYLKVIKLSIFYGAILSIFFGVVYLIFTKELAMIFSCDKVVIDKIVEYRWYLFIMPIFSFIAFIFDGVFIGMTKTKVLKDSVILGTISFLSVFYIFKNYD